MIDDYKQTVPGLSGRELTDALVKELLLSGRYVSSEEEWRERNLRILRDEKGKPRLCSGQAVESDQTLPSGQTCCPGSNDPEQGIDPGILLSVSHTGTVFGCVIASTEECSGIGFDIQLARSSNTDKIARRWFSPEEIQWIGDQPDGFYRLWTRKEAYAKLTGEGLSSILERTPVLGRRDVVFRDLNLGDGLFGCICSSLT